MEQLCRNYIFKEPLYSIQHGHECGDGTVCRMFAEVGKYGLEGRPRRLTLVEEARMLGWAIA